MNQITELSIDEIDEVSGGLPLLAGWAIASACGCAIGWGAAYLVSKYCQ